MTKAAAFWDKAAEKYAASPIADEDTYQRKLEITRAYLTPESDVLEFGCGTGSTALLHAPHVKHILATDISGEMIEIAKGKAAEQGISNVDFVRAGLEDIDVPPASQDVVLGLNILHLLPDWEEAIRRSYTWLKPGGAFITSTGCLADGFNMYRLIIPPMRLIGKAPYVAFIKGDDLRRAMTDAGFQIEHDWKPEKSQTLFLVAKKPA